MDDGKAGGANTVRLFCQFENQVSNECLVVLCD